MRMAPSGIVLTLNLRMRGAVEEDRPRTSACCFLISVCAELSRIPRIAAWRLCLNLRMRGAVTISAPKRQETAP